MSPVPGEPTVTPRCPPTQEQRYASLFAQHPDGMCELDPEGRVLAGNAALGELTGVPVANLIGHPFLALLPPNEREHARSELDRTRAGDAHRFEATLVGRHRGDVRAAVTAIPIRDDDGHVVGLHATLRDRSRAETARRAMLRSEARLRQVFESASAGIAVLTPSGIVLRANPALLAMLGVDQEDLTTRDLWDLTHHDDVLRLREGLRLLLDTDRASVAVEVRAHHGAGHFVWLRVTLTTMEWSDDVPTTVMLTAEDVTSLREIDDRLEQSQSLVRMAGRMARVGGWRIDLATGQTQLSDEVREVLQLAGGQSLDLRAALASYPPTDRERVEAALDTCAREAVAFDLEVQISPSGHPPMWIRLIGEPEHDLAGRVVGIRGVAQDIGDRRVAEQESQELAQRLTATFESITDAVMTVDASWRFTYCNRRATELLRRDRARLLGRAVWEELPHLRGTVVEDTARRVVETGRTEVVEAFHDETLRGWFELNLYPAPEGGVTVYFRDVSEQHRARVQLRQQARLLDRARDAIVVRDADGRVTYWNHSAERLYGWRDTEALGQLHGDLVAGDGAAFEAALAHTRTTGEWTGELTQVDRLGRELVVEARWTLVHDDEVRPTILTITTDVTERKQLEAQFLQAQRMESLGTLASGIAHDLNNALSPVLMASELLADETDPERRELVDVIAGSARRGADMVQQVLSFARGVDGRRIAVDLGAIIGDLERLARETFPKHVAIRTNVAPDLWPVTGDPTQLHQVLLNLCVNARDAMPRVGTLSLSLANLVVEGRQRVHRPDLAPGPYVRITVSDTGHGMSREVLERIFEPFYTTKAEETGSGLGLSTSMGIVESHGGSLEAHSRPGVGSIFTIDLPATPSAAASASEAPAPATAGRGELVLLVDDEPAIRRLGRQTLEGAGYRVLTAGDGREAVELAHTHEDELALVITDVMMPQMDGITAVDRIRASSTQLPAVLISGLRTELERTPTRPGVDHRLRKPFTTAELLGVVSEALSSGTPPTW